MPPERDSIHHAQLARKARQLAAKHADPVVSRHLREMAIKHDRKARELARAEGSEEPALAERIGAAISRFLGRKG